MSIVSRLAIVHQRPDTIPQRLRPHGIRVCPSATIPAVHIPLARQYIYPLQQIRHRLQTCNVLCHDCKALHWVEELSQKATRGTPKFSTCCMNGTISLPELPNAPILIEELLKDRSNGNFYYIYINN